MDITSVATQMVVVLLLVIAGFVSRKYKLMGGDFDRMLSNFVIQVTCPCLIIASTMGDKMPDRSHILSLLAISILTYAILISIAYVLPRFMPVKKEDRGMYSFMLTFANVGFIGYPIVASIFGQDAVFYACILNAPNTFCIFIWGVMFVNGSGSGKFNPKILCSTAMIATYLSIVIVVVGWRAPSFIALPFTILGNMTVPSALLIIGSSIADIPARQMTGSKGSYIVALFRLLILPVGIYYLMEALGFEPMICAINAVLIGMPVASYGTMFCMRYGKDATAMTQGTFVTTLLSVLSIPLLAWLIS